MLSLIRVGRSIDVKVHEWILVAVMVKNPIELLRCEECLVLLCAWTLLIWGVDQDAASCIRLSSCGSTLSASVDEKDGDADLW
jgi:hypothetical protein